MNKELILHENLIEVDLLNDFWEYQKKSRESFYYLSSKNIQLESVIVLNNRSENESNKIKAEIQRLYNESKSLIVEYKQHDSFSKKMNEEDHNSIKEVAITNVKDDLTYLDGKRIVELFENCIKLKCEMDKMQLEILHLLIEESKNLIQCIIKGFKNLENKFLIEINESLLSVQTNHSVDEDKIITYCINIKNQSHRKDMIKEGVDFPRNFKCVDYTYVLTKKREEYKKFNRLVIENLGLVETEMVFRNEKKRNNLQFFFNVIVTISTIITLIITILQVIYN